MKILVLGAYGMLGHKLVQVLGQDFDVWATCRVLRKDVPESILPRDRLLSGVTAEDLDGVSRAMAEVRPDLVVNAIGVIKQRDEAHDPVPSLTINSLFPHRLAVLCRVAGARLVHFGTDCVFSGQRGNYAEDDVPDAHDLYGRTKLLGEVTGEGCLTIRSSIVGPELGGAVGLFGWFMSQHNGRVKGYRNAIYSGLTTLEMANLVRFVATEHPGLSGMWQVASEPICKYDLLSRVNARLELGIEIVPDHDFRCDRSLDGSRFAAATGYKAPSWDEMIDRFARDLEASQLVPIS